MKIAFLVFNLTGPGGTTRSVISQANALVGLGEGHDVRLLSVTRVADEVQYAVDDDIAVDFLVDLRDAEAPRLAGLDDAVAARLHDRGSLLVPERWDRQFSALTDVALERALTGLDADVLVTVTPGLLASAERLLPDRVTLVHQEHRSSSDREGNLEPLLTYGARADVVALLTESNAAWLREQLGEAAPRIVVMPNPLPPGFVPRSRRDNRTIVTAGRLVPEKQFGQLIRAFAQVAGELPGWRLRIFGEGRQKQMLLGTARKCGLFDRVELPGSTEDLAGEWAAASIGALCSQAEGYPLVLQEAMAAGVPCVSYDCPSGPREIITHEHDGLLVLPGSEAGLASALRRLALDAELRDRLGEAAAETARAWEPEALAERWLALFTEAVTAHRAGGSGSGRASGGRISGRLLGAESAPASASSPQAAQCGGEGITPAAARRTALELAAGVAAATADGWFVIPGEPPTVVVPGDRRAAFLRALAAAEAPGWLSLADPGDNGWPPRRGMPAGLAPALASVMTPRVALEPWPEGPDGPTVLSQGCGVDVQFWDADPAGAWRAPLPNAYVARTVPGPRVTRSFGGLDLPTLPVMQRPAETEVAFDVDVVFTWVDGSDRAWQKAQHDRLTAIGGGAASAAGRARFESRDELRYALRSVHLFAPWARRIHLVTAGQIPDWLDQTDPRIRVVDHREILPPEALPTFNSHAIETALGAIPGLAEHFVYFNDDMMLARPLSPERFFDAAGRAAVFLSDHLIGAAEAPEAGKAEPPAYAAAALHNRRLLEQATGHTITRHLAHAPYALTRSMLAAVAERFPAEVEATQRTPFRSARDVSIASSLAQHLGLLTGTAYAAATNTMFVDLSSTNVTFQFGWLRRRDRDTICLGDHEDYAFDVGTVDALLADFLDDYFPIAAPWER